MTATNDTEWDPTATCAEVDCDCDAIPGDEHCLAHASDRDARL